MIEFENLQKLNRRFATDFHNRLEDVLRNGQFILGDQLKEFEKQFALYCGSKYCVGVGNGTDALTLSLKAFSFPKNAEVIVAANTYIATVMAVINAGLKPVLVEPDISTYNIESQLIESVISKDTVALMAVHLFGKCCDMSSIQKITSPFGVVVIEDCAQSHGAAINGKRAGTFGDIAAFSFYPTKNLGALGDAGCVNTDKEDLRMTIEILRNYGSGKKYYNETVGVNSRMDELQAAFLNVKLSSLDDINDHKRSLSRIYSENLKEDFIKPAIQSGFKDVYHIYNVRHPQRNRLREYLLKNGVETEIHYPVPVYKQNALKDFFKGKNFPISDAIHDTTLSLPISLIHSEEDIFRVVDVMNKF